MDNWRTKSNAPTSGTELGALTEIGPSGKEFLFGKGLNTFRLFVVRQGDGARAYVNACPHYSLPLNHRPDEFLSRDRDRIMCRQHLALFAIDDGRCLDGACEGQGLQAIPIRLVGETLVID